MANFHAGSWLAILLGVAIALSSLSGPVNAALSKGLKNGFYYKNCPNVESIIYNSMSNSYRKDKGVAPGVLRLAFHDCFVRGCDASVLLDGAQTEKTSIVNGGLRGFDAIDAAKEAVEKACPGVVSCADILQFAARDSVVLAGGQTWYVPAGRRDGTVSLSTDPINNLPSPEFSVPKLLPLFKNKGLNADQMVTLSGAHSIGISSCNLISSRLYNFKSPSGVDPSLPTSFAASLKKQCPSPQSTNTVNLDLVTPRRFDHQYFQNIIQKRGLFTSDQSLLNDARTKKEVYANNGGKFGSKFGEAMIAMSKVDVLTGRSGQIRKHCRFVNH